LKKVKKKLDRFFEEKISNFGKSEKQAGMEQ
jgi:hypothetical protein